MYSVLTMHGIIGHKLFVFLLLCFFCAAKTFHDAEQEKRIKSLKWAFVYPTMVTEEGNFKSHAISYRSKRDTGKGDRLNYQITLFDSPVQLILDPNYKLYSNHLVIEKRFKNKENGSADDYYNHCFFTGKIKEDSDSRVAISTCNGLTGVIMSSDGHYFIEPVKGHELNLSQPYPHIVYKAAHAENTGPLSPNSETSELCSNRHDAPKVHRDGNQAPKVQRTKRSYSREYFVETLVVVDHSMVEYYKKEDINTYIFTIMNMVSVLFHDASIGNAININIVKLLLLDKDQEKIEGLEISHHADNTLSSFCKWQKTLNPQEPDPTHHDVAILITRLDICNRMNEPCSTLGLAQVSGMCQPGRSCNVNEDTGLALAYTIAHELGHNFGMKHDGLNDCGTPPGDKSYIMFADFLIDAGRPLIWSNCSRDAVTKFLDRDWGYCLLDEPDNIYHYSYPDKPPGVLYDVDHQCRLQYGSDAEHCDGIENMCTTLWCRVNNHCITRLEPAAEGTICDWDNTTDAPIPRKWCFDGKCTEIDSRPGAIDGAWAEWTEWTTCSRTCGGGVSISERLCINPAPANGGKYCIGERKRYRICSTDLCQLSDPTFLEVQCSAYNKEPYKGVIYDWEPASTNNPCQLNCKPKNMYFSVMLNDMVKDGTPCLPGTKNMCITGRCRKVGCDWKLDSNATEDRCGVCHGDGSSCKTVKDQFKGQITPESDSYVEAMVIPEGARNIRIEEIAEANNYLAVKSANGDYYLNGHWYIQWTGNYNMAGTTVHYERLGNKEGITAPGPITEPLHIMLLFQSHNPGVTFEYTVPNQNGTVNATRVLQFKWELLDWSHCSLSCGGGYQRKKVVCMEKEAGIVDDAYCNSTKPDDQAKSCNEHLCPARWWSGPWQHCSVSCGEGGLRQRTVLCVRSLGPEEQMALDDIECSVLPKPVSKEPCKTVLPPCPNLWRTGPWSECSKSCGGGVKHRTVECMAGVSCKAADRPEDLIPCNEFACSAADTVFHNKLVKSVHNRFEVNTDEKTIYQKALPGPDGNIWNKLWNLVVGQNKDTENMKPSTPSIPITVYNESWHAAEWGPCSAVCGLGQKKRQVWCPRQDLCDPASKPNHVTECSGQPCISWVAGSWSQCSATCGGGTQQRNVQCINMESDKAVESCDEKERPASEQECNAAEKCESVSAGNAVLSKWNGEDCTADTLALETCRQLNERGFCAFKYVSRNCCQTCKI